MSTSRKEKKTLERLLHEFAQAYFVDRDYVKLIKHMSMQISWIGTGINEVCRNFLDATRYLQMEQETYSGKFILSNERYHVNMLSDNLACAMATMEVDADPASGHLVHLSLRFSAVFILQGGVWKVCHVHNSVPYHSQGTADFFDRRAAQEHFNQAKELAVVLAADQVKAMRLEDTLTGILNMEGFAQRARELQEANPAIQYALVKFNVNHFRYINQNFGYPVGDRVLRNIALNLKRNCSRKETCGRIDKDNFALLAVFKSRDEIDGRMTWLYENLVDKDVRAALKKDITFTGGVYLLGHGGDEEIKDALDKAFIAQKTVKRSEWESTHAYFDSQTYERMLYQTRLIEEAPRAIELCEFKLFVQPQVDLKSGHVVGGEALVRWIKADTTFIMPDDFIPLFEQSDFVLEFDFYMLELLCQHMRQWIDDGLEVVPISINQSRRHLNKPFYLNRFCDTVDRYALPHSLIVFELTESAFVEHNDEMLFLSENLHQLGFRLAIDDFGTGYSTLNFFGTVEADIMKIDRSILVGIDTAPRGQLVLKTVVALAKESMMTVVCEGVETAEQVDYLKQLGCDVAQGYYFAHPVPVEEFRAEMLEKKPLALV